MSAKYTIIIVISKLEVNYSVDELTAGLYEVINGKK